MSETTHQHTRTLLDASAVVNIPPARFRQVLEEVHSQSQRLFVPGSFNALLNKNLQEDHKRPLKHFRENYKILNEYLQRGLTLDIRESADGLFSDIRTAAKLLARESERMGQRIRLITADTTLVTQIALLGIKIDILRFSADAQTPDAEAYIPIENFDTAAETMRYPWENGKPHHQTDPRPNANAGQPTLDLFIQDDGAPIHLQKLPDADGAEAVLYCSDAYPEYIAKVFKHIVAGKPLDAGKLNNVHQLKIVQQHNDIRYAILPEKELCDEHGNVVGYLMRRVKNFENFARLSFQQTQDLDVQVCDAVRFCAEVVWQLLHLADLGIQIYDFCKNNLGLDMDSGELVTLDSDSFLKGNYLPYSSTNYFTQPELAYDKTTRSEAIAACIKSAYLFVAYVLLGKPALDKHQKLNASWDTDSYRIPEPLESFLRKAVQMDPEDVPYLDALMEKLDVVLQTPVYQDCTYRQLQEAKHTTPPKHTRDRGTTYAPWESVLHSPDGKTDEPVFLIPEGVFELRPNPVSGTRFFGWPRKKERTTSKPHHLVGVPPPTRYPPADTGTGKQSKQQKKRRARNLRLLLIALLLMLLFVVDIAHLQQLPLLIGKFRDACSVLFDRTLGALWNHPMNPIPGWLESLGSVLSP